MRLWIPWPAVAAALIGGSSFACANTAPDTPPLPNQLDRLRVLAIAANPPELFPGESATLDALVFEPNAAPTEFAWSWCPMHIDVELGLACPMAESLWAELWASAGLEGTPPPYDLGSEAAAVLQPALQADAPSRLCGAIAALGPAAESARGACADGFEANVVLRVRAGGEEEVSIKRVPLLPAEAPPQARNQNPGPLGTVSLRVIGTEEAVSDGTLIAGRNYTVRVELSEELSEVLPEANAGAAESAQPAGERRETLVLSWFITPGETSAPDGGDDEVLGLFEDAEHRTIYVPGQSAFDELLEKGWRVPQSDRQTAELILVLRDGRGGVAWRRDQFLLVEVGP
jgi:hypothetical protein